MELSNEFSKMTFNSSLENIHKLPIDMFYSIYRYLPIGDCTNLTVCMIKKYNLVYNNDAGKAKFLCDSIKNVNEDRLDPVKYLSKSFKHPLTLLATLHNTGSILSGSRALEYFVPGSTIPTSDWDFYVPAKSESVPDMITVLSSSVKWTPFYMQLYNFVSMNRPGSIIVSVVDLQTYVHSIINIYGGRRLNTARDNWPFLLECAIMCYDISIDRGDLQATITLMLNLIDSEVKIARITISSTDTSNGSVMTLEKATPEEISLLQLSDINYDSTVQVIRGTTHSGESVQLIQSSRGINRNILDPIFEFYASHVQCAITGTNALHLYYTTAARRMSRYWEITSSSLRSHFSFRPQARRMLSRSANSLESVNLSIQKHLNRGVTFYSHRWHKPSTNKRHILDNQSMVVPFDKYYSKYGTVVPLSTLTDVSDQLHNVIWVETKYGICRLSVVSPDYVCQSGYTAEYQDCFEVESYIDVLQNENPAKYRPELIDSKFEPIHSLDSTEMTYRMIRSIVCGMDIYNSLAVSNSNYL